MLGITWRNIRRATWIMEETKVKSITMTLKKKKLFIMRRTDNRLTTKVTAWQPRNSKRNQSRQKIRWREEIMTFGGVGWIH